MHCRATNSKVAKGELGRGPISCEQGQYALLLAAQTVWGVNEAGMSSRADTFMAQGHDVPAGRQL
jgi:hypothetical protein